ncbi:MAG: hypothetical protein PHE29_04950 [Tissierellia bacterium]|nr:hypothetical protein [Tissierellia bacterium]
MDSYFCLLKNKIRLEYEKQNKSKLIKYNTDKSEVNQFETYQDLENHIHKLLNLFTSNENNIVDNIDKKLAGRLIDQYEEKKENDIIVGVLNEKVKNDYFVYITIFETDVAYERILFKKFTDIDQSKSYFEELKTLININNIESLSKKILEKL